MWSQGILTYLHRPPSLSSSQLVSLLSPPLTRRKRGGEEGGRTDRPSIFLLSLQLLFGEKEEEEKRRRGKCVRRWRYTYTLLPPLVDVGEEEEERPGFELLHIHSEEVGRGRLTWDLFCSFVPLAFLTGRKRNSNSFLASLAAFSCPLSPPLPCSHGKLKRRKKGEKKLKSTTTDLFLVSPLLPAANELWMSLSLSSSRFPLPHQCAARR